MLLLCAGSAMLFACGKSGNNENGPVTFQNDKERNSYAVGLSFGHRIYDPLKEQGLDSTISKELLVKGLTDAIMGNEGAMSLDSAGMYTQQFFMQLQEAQMQQELKKYENNKAEGAKFLEDNAKREGVKTTETGLQYEVIKMGNGKKPALGDSATVHYTGTFINGEKFDSSVDRGEPFTFMVNFGQVIDGWVEAAQLMPEGSKFKVYIPSELAYGESMRPGMPPYSTLIFDIEMIKVHPQK